MRKHYINYGKKIMAIMLTGAFALAASGCGDKTVDYGSEGGGSGESNASDSETIATKYNIPEECNVSIDVGKSTLERIEINDEDVTYPDTSSMDIVYYTKKEFSNEIKKNVAEAIFDKDEGIYEYDEYNIKKSDLQREIKRYERGMKAALYYGDDESAKLTQEYIDEMTEQLDSAPDEYEAAGDYSGDSFIGMIDGTEYRLALYENYSYLFLREDDIDHRPLEGADEIIDCYCATSEDFDASEIEGLTNMCKLSESEAQSIAEDFMASIGINDMILEQTDGLYWNYYDSYTDEADTIEMDGYVFYFTRAIGNAAVSTVNPVNASNFTDDENGDLEIPTEHFTISIDSNGIVDANWTWYLESAGETEKNVSLLTFDELLDAANENISEYYVTYPTHYTEIEFNKMELTYFPEETDEEGVFKYAPAWILSQFEVYQDSSGEKYPYQIVVIDATDGSVVDLLSLSKALGTYYDYSD